MIYTLSKLFTAIFLPPGLLLLIFVFSIIFFKRAKIFLYIGLSISYLLTTNAFALYPLKLLEQEPIKPILTNEQSVVVLGGGAYNGHPHISFGSDALKRAIVGISYASRYDLPLYFTGGGDGIISEADAFKELFHGTLKEIGVNQNIEINLEQTSLNTVENARNLRNILHSNEIALVTSAYHMKRAELIFKHFGFKVTKVPTDYKRDYPSNLKWRDFLPSIGGIYKNYIYLHEVVGILSLMPQRIWP